MRLHAKTELDDKQKRRRRRIIEDRANRMFSVPLLPGETHAVLVVKLAEGATAPQVKEKLEGLGIIQEVTDMAPMRLPDDFEADETQHGRVVVDTVSRTITVPAEPEA